MARWQSIVSPRIKPHMTELEEVSTLLIICLPFSCELPLIPNTVLTNFFPIQEAAWLLIGHSMTCNAPKSMTLKCIHPPLPSFNLADPMPWQNLQVFSFIIYFLYLQHESYCKNVLNWITFSKWTNTEAFDYSFTRLWDL